MTLRPGARGEATLVVGAADTATALGSGDVAVLGTPRLVALCEAATVAAVRHLLPQEQTTVGTRIDVEHLRPSPVGSTVSATAVLVAVEGRRLMFEVEAAQDGATVGRGTVARAVVERARFG